MDPLVRWLTQYGYVGLFGLLVFGIVGLPIPDETLLVFSGYLISKGKLHPVFTFLAGFLGSACGISLSYAIGRIFGMRFVRKYGRWLRLSEDRVQRIHDWFDRIGHWLLTIGYYIPGVRHFTALVAGMSCLEFRAFAFFAYLGAALWVASFLALGYFFGEKWEAASSSVQRYILVLSAAVLAGAAVWWFRKKRKGRKAAVR